MRSFVSVRHIAMAAIGAMTPALAAGAAADWDFQSDAIGSEPAAYEVYYDAGNADVRVVDGSSIFGEAGNKSLQITDDSTAGAGVGIGRAKFRADVEPITQGTLAFQFYLDGSADHQGFNVVIANNMWSEIGPWINYFDNYRGFHVQGASNYWGLDNAIQYNTVHSLVIEFDAVAGTFTGTLDGAALKASHVDGVLVDEPVTVFPFYESIPGVRGVSITSGISDFAGYNSYYDNIELSAVPEPASLGLFGCAGLLLLGRRKH